jgi:FixJ family two-component response regulator
VQHTKVFTTPWYRCRTIERMADGPGDHIVYIVDDDPRVRDAVVTLLDSFGMDARPFGSAAEYLEYARPDVAACLILDVELPDMNGLDLQRWISAGRAHGDGPHIVFVTGHGDIPSSVRAMKAGAVDFLTKPFRQEDLMSAIESALRQNRAARSDHAELAELTERFSSLTPRELQVFSLVIAGLLNKQAAARLGIAENTLQIHRGSIMKKMRAGSLAELVRMGTALERRTG